eukprot:gene9296-1384_t
MFKQIDGKFGKCLVSTKSLSAGELILKENPSCHVVTDSLLSTNCQNCLTFLKKKFRCNNCQYIYYCSPKCQKEDWINHKHECKSILKISPNKPTESIRLMGRVLQKRLADESFYKKYQNLISHYDQKKDDKELLQMGVLVHQFISEESKIPLESIVENFCRFKCNNFCINDEDQNTLGTGIYLTASSLNHSCEPNSVVIFNSNELQLRNIRPIETNEELTISYIELASSYNSRNSLLQSQYFFTCTCQKCEKKINDEFLTGLICSECKVLLENRICKKCKKSMNINKFESQFKTSMDFYKDGKFEECYKIQKKLLYFQNEYLIKTLASLIKKSIDNQQFNKAIDYSLVILPIYEFLYPDNYPILGLEYFILAKIYWYFENAVDALVFFKKASNILKICFGKNHHLTKDLYEKIKLSEMELHYRGVQMNQLKKIK